jgi:hypothetical protein
MECRSLVRRKFATISVETAVIDEDE